MSPVIESYISSQIKLTFPPLSPFPVPIPLADTFDLQKQANIKYGWHFCRQDNSRTPPHAGSELRVKRGNSVGNTIKLCSGDSSSKRGPDSKTHIFTCIYIHIHTHICIYIHICIFIYVYVWMYMHLYIHMYIHTLHVSLHLRILSLLVKRSDTELRNVQISLVSGPIFSSYNSDSLHQVQFFPATSLILSSKSNSL